MVTCAYPSDLRCRREPAQGKAVCGTHLDALLAAAFGPHVDPILRPGAEPSGVLRDQRAGALRSGSPDGGSPETERAIASATPGRTTPRHDRAQGAGGWVASPGPRRLPGSLRAAVAAPTGA